MPIRKLTIEDMMSKSIKKHTNADDQEIDSEKISYYAL